MNCFRLVQTWMILLSTSQVCSSFSTCTDEPHFVTSTSNYTEVDISSVFRQRSCTWILERDDCSRLGVEMIISNLELYETDTTIDFYDGPSKTYPSLGSYSYDYYNYDLDCIKRSSGRFLTLVVRGGYHISSSFYLKYRNIPSDESLNTQRRVTENTVSDTCGTEILLAYPTPNSITSPDYPREYDNSLDCKWIVVSDDTCNDDVIQVKIHALSLDTNDDHLIFYDGRRTFDPVLANVTGNQKEEVITASGRSMLIEFKTGDTVTDQGFHLSYFRKKATPSISDAITAKITKTTAEISADFTTSTARSYRSVLE
ncbi:tolloid-like protein 2 isoform X2 [Argopecten irradians]|uniref:tolloid-like protein 2 isoform X2 n=1 Tax=Argopecten irradians TaxID=31199 RepID=UPI003712A373